MPLLIMPPLMRAHDDAFDDAALLADTPRTPDAAAAYFATCQRRRSL